MTDGFDTAKMQQPLSLLLVQIRHVLEPFTPKAVVFFYPKLVLPKITHPFSLHNTSTMTTPQDFSQLTTAALRKKKQLHKTLLGVCIGFALAIMATVLYLSVVERLFSSSFVALFAILPALLFNATQLKPIDDELNNRKHP